MLKTPVMFFLQNAGMGYLGNSPYWWKEGGGGYTTDIDQAQQFTAEECKTIIRGSKGTHNFKRWLVNQVLAATYRTVDFQLLK